MKRFVVSSVAIVLSLALGEVGLRSAPTGRARVDGFKVADPVLHHRLRPNARGAERSDERGVEIRINALGLRDREYESVKPPGTYRILMLGDSVTFGTGLALEETVAKLLERSLPAAAGPHWEVINAGVPSYSPLLEYLLLKHVGLQLGPDLVIVNFDMTDLRDDLVRTELAQLDATGLPVAVPQAHFTEAALIMPPLNAIERRLHRSAIYQLVRKSSWGKELLGPLRLTAREAEARGLAGNVYYDPVAVSRCEDHLTLRTAWRLSERYIVGIRDLTRPTNIPLVVTIYPHAHQIAPYDHATDPTVRLCPERPFRMMEAVGERHRIPVINLLSHFRRRAVAGPLFVGDGIHHTPEGAEVFTEGVLEGLSRHELIARSSGR